jgi:hypothetical protein
MKGCDAMTTIELAQRVQAMRQAQKLCFRVRTLAMEALDESRRLERELDNLVDEILVDRPAMLPLFDAAEGEIKDEDSVEAAGERAFEAGAQEWADWNMDNNPFGD